MEYLTAMKLADCDRCRQQRGEPCGGDRGIRATWPPGPLTGYATLARLREAALKADAGDLPGAAALWDQVASDSSADPLLRDLANLLWAQHLIDSGDPSLLEARLKALASAG